MRRGGGAAAAPGSAAASAALAELIKAPPLGADAPGVPPPAAAGSAQVPPASPCGPTEVDLIVHARWVVPVAPGHEQLVLDHHSVVVDGGRIVDVLPQAS